MKLTSCFSGMPSGDHFSSLQWGKTHFGSYPPGLALCCLWSSTGVPGRHLHEPFSGAVPAADLLRAGGFLNYSGVAVYAIILRCKVYSLIKKKKLKNPYLYSSCWLSPSLVAAGTIYQKSWRIHAKGEYNKTTRPKMRHCTSLLHRRVSWHNLLIPYFWYAEVASDFSQSRLSFRDSLVTGGEIKFLCLSMQRCCTTDSPTHSCVHHPWLKEVPTGQQR